VVTVRGTLYWMRKSCEEGEGRGLSSSFFGEKKGLGGFTGEVKSRGGKIPKRGKIHLKGPPQRPRYRSQKGTAG